MKALEPFILTKSVRRYNRTQFGITSEDEINLQCRFRNEKALWSEKASDGDE